MSFEYKEENLVLIYKGQNYEFRAPSAIEQRQISRKFKEADENADVVGLYVDFFVQLGCPQDVLEKMSMTGLLDLFAYSVGAKKN